MDFPPETNTTREQPEHLTNHRTFFGIFFSEKKICTVHNSGPRPSPKVFTKAKWSHNFDLYEQTVPGPQGPRLKIEFWTFVELGTPKIIKLSFGHPPRVSRNQNDRKDMGNTMGPLPGPENPDLLMFWLIY